MAFDRDGQLKPTGLDHADQRFERICPFSPKAADEDAIALARYPDAEQADRRLGRFERAYVGHVAEAGFRTAGSSGGMVSWVAARLLNEGLVDGVAHVIPRSPGDGDGRLFAYAISRDVESLRRGAKSRYYPVELSGVLRLIAEIPGRYAVVGVPCFIKAINLLRREVPLFDERITFTIGLFCGHMKSALMVESFAWQMGAPQGAVAAIDYRLKDAARPANWYRARLDLADGSSRERDWWRLADGDWGSGFFMNSACGYCDDVVAETADIALGDAWVEPYASDGRGTNVVLVRTARLNQLLCEAAADGRLELTPVDADFVAETQAAGLRQRREGLAWRLARLGRPALARKRVAPSRAMPRRGKLIYWLRAAISAWSPRVLRTARRLRWPGLFIGWGKATRWSYHALAYAEGRWQGWRDS